MRLVQPTRQAKNVLVRTFYGSWQKSKDQKSKGQKFRSLKAISPRVRRSKARSPNSKWSERSRWLKVRRLEVQLPEVRTPEVCRPEVQRPEVQMNRSPDSQQDTYLNDCMVLYIQTHRHIKNGQCYTTNVLPEQWQTDYRIFDGSCKMYK